MPGCSRSLCFLIKGVCHAEGVLGITQEPNVSLSVNIRSLCLLGLKRIGITMVTTETFSHKCVFKRLMASSAVVTLPQSICFQYSVSLLCIGGLCSFRLKR